MRFRVEIYENENGEVPFLSFLLTLPEKLRAKVLWSVNLLEEMGNDLREPYSKELGDGIYELRTIQGSNIVRSLYFFFKERAIVITGGFLKKTRKTPVREIKKAVKHRNDWLRRHGNDL